MSNETVNSFIKMVIEEDLVNAQSTLKEYLNEKLISILQEKYEDYAPTIFEAKGDGNLANNYPPFDKVTRGDVIAGAKGEDQMGGKNEGDDEDEMASDEEQSDSEEENDEDAETEEDEEEEDNEEDEEEED